MSTVKRIYVEKKSGFDIEGVHLLNEFISLLNITKLKKVRVLNRYDLDGIDIDDYNQSKTLIFSEPPVDHIYEENFPISQDELFFSYEYLPGQYDQRADSAAQCIQLLSEKEKCLVTSAKVLVLKGEITKDELESIKKYVINPVEAREALIEKPDTLLLSLDLPKQVKTLTGFITMNDKDRLSFMAFYGLAMNIEDVKFIQDYFTNIEKRDPTITEIKVIDTYWSDHCRHTTFLTKIDSVKIEPSKYLEKCQQSYEQYLLDRKIIYKDKNEKHICLMDLALASMKYMKVKGLLPDLEETDEINACSIVIDADINGENEEWLVMFKNETHNHPTEIEPFGGAATCLGGAIRDPLSGRAYVYQAMRVTGCANPNTPISQTIKGKLPQIKISRKAANGYSSYGNQIGLATGQVKEIYDEGFVAKRMEIGAVIAAVPRKNVTRGKALPGDIIVLLGGRTGRDGCGGATGSSKEHDEQSLASCGAEVQKGNPPTERKIQRLFRNEKVSKMIKVCNDFGAGGVSVAIGELASSLIIDLDKVRKKYEGLDGTELAISESQERMAVVINKEDYETFLAYASEENIEAYQVATITDDKRLIMTWKGKDIVNISREFLDTNGVTQHVDIKVKAPKKDTFFTTEVSEKNIKQRLIDKLSSLNACSQKGLVEQFDSSIGGATVLMPFGGVNQLTPQEGMAALLPTLEKTNTATIMSFGYHPSIGKWSPFHGAFYAVLESVAKIVAMGGNVLTIRLTLQEYFEKLYKEPTRWGKPLAALLGAYYIQRELGIAAIGGKDSMSGTFKDIDVPPTLVSFAVNTIKASQVVSAEFKNQQADVVIIKPQINDDLLPDLQKLKKSYITFNKLVKEGKVLAAATVKEEGLLATITKMSFGNSIGFTDEGISSNVDYFSKSFGTIVAQVTKSDGMTIIGKTINKPVISVSGEEISIFELLPSYIKPLEKVFKTTETPITGDIIIKEHKTHHVSNKKISIAKPRIFIPVFPGTNCEYDVKKAFDNAGGLGLISVFKNLTTNDIHESAKIMVEKINNSQIIMLPGGFSAGDEPDGSGKFIATVFRHPAIKEALLELLNQRDGLILGICNGFQALIKLGLVPYGDIIPMTEQSPTLTFNKIGRHVSCMVNTKIVSNKSPWLSLVSPGDVHSIPISHGEGRFVANDSIIKSLFDNGQVATQYVDSLNQPTYDIKYNPNGSYHAIEGITSFDGRVFGKMGHSERIGENVLKNIPGNHDQQIFLSGVRYFK